MTTPMASAPKQLETKWTPGPWEVGGNATDEAVSADGREGECWIICDLGLPCDLVGINPDNLSARVLDERTANARLIAAAPEMAEALRLWGKYDSGEDENGIDLMLNYNLALEATQAVLAKIGVSQ